MLRASPVAGLMLATLSFAQAPSPAQSGSVDVEVFKGPQQKNIPLPTYPMLERAGGRDGWVALSFMIDPGGKPYEVMVMDSTGNKALERAAVEGAQQWEFEPATLGGKPIESSHAMKVVFVLKGDAGAGAEFIDAYRKFLSAIRKQDREKADRTLAAMQVRNLYEDAYFNLAQAEYARQWGTELQRLEALERAIAREKDATYLPKDTFLACLQALLELQIKANDFAGALETWGKLESLGDAALLAPWTKTIENVRALRTDGRPYAVEGDFAAASYWEFQLYRNRFHFLVKSGRIAEVKLRCEKKFVFFKVEPEVQYTIADKYGACGLELIGDPGTKFQLVQS